MCEHLAHGALAARTRTRIHALGLHASPVPGAVAVVAALWPTVAERIAVVAGQACAFAGTATVGVGAAWRRIAGIRGERLLWTLRLRPAAGEWIAGVARQAGTDRSVLVDMAGGRYATRAGARIGASLVEARLVAGALGTDSALRPAGGRRTVVVGQARALRLVAVWRALRVGAAGRRQARIARWLVPLGWLRSRYRRTAHKRIAFEAAVAGTVDVVIGHMAAGVLATDARARVRAPQLDTGQLCGALGAGGALGSAAGRRAKVRGPTGAYGLAVGGFALAVGAARRWRTGIGWLRRRCDRFVAHNAAHAVRIAVEARPTGAGGLMVDHLTVGVRTANARTRIDAVRIDAGPIR